MKDKCAWCGKTIEEHTGKAGDIAVPKVPCLMRKEGFIIVPEAIKSPYELE